MCGSKFLSTSQLKIEFQYKFQVPWTKSKIPTEIELNRNEKKQIQLKRFKLKHRVANNEYDKITVQPIPAQCAHSGNLQIMHLMYHTQWLPMYQQQQQVQSSGTNPKPTTILLYNPHTLTSVTCTFMCTNPIKCDVYLLYFICINNNVISVLTRNRL